MNYISNIMGWVLAQLSGLFGHNFAASVFVFTLLVNVAMLPFTLKTQKSSAKQAKLKPKLDALKKKYGNDRQKYSQAMSELYQKENVSMSGGCLPMIIRLFVMMGVYWAIASPISFVLQVDSAAVTAAKNWTSYVKVVESDTTIDWQAAGIEEAIKSDKVVILTKEYGDKDETYYAKIILLDNANAAKEPNSVQKTMQTAIKKNAVAREVELFDRIKTSPIVKANFIAKGGSMEELDKIDFDLLGLDLTQTPKFSWNFSKFDKYWLIPIFAFLSSLATSLVTSKLQKKANPEAPNMTAMMVGTSGISLYFAFTFPCAVGFYWICSSLISGGIQALTQALYGPDVVIAKDQAKSVIARAKKEQEKINLIDK